MRIDFSPPDITEEEIQAVADTLRSGWITTGPQTKRFEQELAAWCTTPRVACLNSATAALECTLHLLGIKAGDEVITSAYTYTASASVICHVGATPVLVDTAPGSYQMDYQALAAAVTPRTKAVIPIDIAGVICDYDKLIAALGSVKELYTPARGSIQELFDRVIIVADGAHSFGATRHGQPSGSIADFTSFSFHAVKNLTTAEGGALTWRKREGLDDEALYKRIMLYSLHGQDKDALSKNQAGAWEYDVIAPLYKWNMTDIVAAIGLVQLRRYPELLERRREILGQYTSKLAQVGIAPVPGAPEVAPAPEQPTQIDILQHYGDNFSSSGHLCLVRLIGRSREFRDRFIAAMAAREITCNVHYKPLPLLSAYRDLGFSIADFPNALAQFANEVTLPLHTKLSDEDIEYVIESFKASYQECVQAGV